MDRKKSKKSSEGDSPKSPHVSRSRSYRTGRHGSAGSKVRSAQQRSKSRSRSHEPRQRVHGSLYRRHSPERKRLSSPQHYRPARYRSRSRSLSPGGRRQYNSFPEKRSRVLGVFGLSVYTDERVLREVFTQYGPVENIQLILDHHSGVSRGFAFIYMKYLDDAVQAKELIPGTEIDGRKIRVDYSFTDFSQNQATAGRPSYGSSGVYNSTYRSPPLNYPSGNGTRSYRARSRSYSPRRY